MIAVRRENEKHFQFFKNDGQGIFWRKICGVEKSFLIIIFCFNLKKDHANKTHDCAFILRSILIHVN